MSGGFWLGRRDGDFENPGRGEMRWHVVISGFVRAGAEVAVDRGQATPALLDKKSPSYRVADEQWRHLLAKERGNLPMAIS